MKIKPLFDRIVLKNVKQELNESSSIILPESADERSEMSIVEELGTGGIIDGNKIEWLVKKGDRVLYNKYSAHEFVVDGETFTIISQDDILGIIEWGTIYGKKDDFWIWSNESFRKWC